MTAHLAQMNIARMRGPADSPVMAPFMAALDEINALAEASPGFVWRLKTAAGNATELQPYPDPMIIVNCSVWASVADLKNYVYRSLHAKFFVRREEWFEKMSEMHHVLWWIPVGTVPTVAKARDRLAHLRQHGETPYSFTFRQPIGAEEGLAAKPREGR